MTLDSIISKILYRFTKIYRKKINFQLASKLNFTVTNGHFKGMKLIKSPFWSHSDLGCKILGVYEHQIQNLLFSIIKTSSIKNFIDIGGADGYYAIGSLVSNQVSHCYVFEKNIKGRQSIKKSAEINQVLDRISILNEANEKTLQELLNSINCKDSIILCDIEGLEYDLFNENIFNKLSNTNLIIEIHSETPTLHKKRDAFLKIVKKYFEVRRIFEREKNFEEIKIINNLRDLDRNIILSEGRSVLGEWWHLKPIKDNQYTKDE